MDLSNMKANVSASPRSAVQSSAPAADLVRGLQSRTIRERVEALDALDRKTLAAVLDRVLANLNHRSAVVRQAAADCLGRLEIAEAVPALLVLLQDASSDVRCSAAEALGSILDSTGKCPPEMLALLSDEDEFCRLIAVESIGMIGDRKVLDELWMRMDDTEPLVRRNLAAVIGELGRRSDRPRLRRLLKDEPAEMARVGILEGLYELGETAVFPQLLQLLESEDYLVQCFIANALGELPLSAEHATAAGDRLRALRKKSTSVAVKEAAAAGLQGLRQNARVPKSQEPRARS
jgi:HEAT repeat protein